MSLSPGIIYVNAYELQVYSKRVDRLVRSKRAAATFPSRICECTAMTIRHFPSIDASRSLWLACLAFAMFVTSGCTSAVRMELTPKAQAGEAQRSVASSDDVNIAGSDVEAIEIAGADATNDGAQEVTSQPAAQCEVYTEARQASKPDQRLPQRPFTNNRHPRTFDEAVEAVVICDRTIKRAFAAEDSDAAHGPLHEIGYVLADMNGLAAAAELNGRQRMSVQIAVAKLFEAFGAVDATMHGKEGVSYSEVSLDIEENLAILKETCPSAWSSNHDQRLPMESTAGADFENNTDISRQDDNT